MLLFFQSAPSFIPSDTCEGHRTVLLHPCHSSRRHGVRLPRKLSPHTAAPQSLDLMGDAGVTPGLARGPEAPTSPRPGGWRSRQLPPRPRPSSPSRPQGCRGKEHTAPSVCQVASVLLATHQDCREDEENASGILPSPRSSDYGHPHCWQRPRQKKTPRKHLPRGKAS